MWRTRSWSCWRIRVRQQPAPEHEQPATTEEIESGEASELQLQRAEAAVEMAQVLRGRAQAGGDDGDVGEDAAGTEAPVCGDFGRRAGDYGGGQSRGV